MRKIIGSGSYGTVYSMDIYNNKKVAVKKIDHVDQGIMIMEPLIMSTLYHPNIQHSDLIKITPQCIYITQDLAYRDLQKYSVSIKIPECLAEMWVYDILFGLKFLHDNRIIHADLKASNILIYKDNRIKITDFSLSYVKTFRELDYPLNWEFDPVDNSMGVCTSTHRPPEAWMFKDLNNKIDLWSLGCLIFETVDGNDLFPLKLFDHIDHATQRTKALDLIENFILDPDKYYQDINVMRSFEKLSQIRKPESNLKNIMMKCLSFNPKDRPSCDDLLKGKDIPLGFTSVKDSSNYVSDHEIDVLCGGEVRSTAIKIFNQIPEVNKLSGKLAVFMASKIHRTLQYELIVNEELMAAERKLMNDAKGLMVF